MVCADATNIAEVVIGLVAADVGVMHGRSLADWDYESGPWRIDDCEGTQQSPVNIAPHTISKLARILWAQAQKNIRSEIATKMLNE